MTDKIKENEQLYEILESCLTAIGCPRGEFYPNKNFGSQLKKYSSQITERQALDFARQAVKDIDGVMVKSAEILKNTAVFTILINNEEGQVTVKL